MPLTVLDIVRAALVVQEFDGLWSPDGECACLRDDLAPCGEIQDACIAGFKGPCDCGEHDWHIYTTREERDAALDKGGPVQAPKPLVYCARKRSDMTPCVITDGDCARDDSGECVGCGRKNVIAGASDPDDYPAATFAKRKGK